MRIEPPREPLAEMILMLFVIMLLGFLLCGCGTLSKMEKQPDGTYKEIPIMSCKTLARDLTYSRTKTTTLSNGTVIVESETYTTKGTTAGVIGSGAQLIGAAASMSPL